MENKTSFYQTDHELKLRRAVDGFYNDIVGGNTNSLYDGEDYVAFTEQDLINSIVDLILKEDRYLRLEGSFEILEAKHIHFMGKDRVREIVTHRVQYLHSKDKWEWEY